LSGHVAVASDEISSTEQTEGVSLLGARIGFIELLEQVRRVRQICDTLVKKALSLGAIAAFGL
jgi:hypothetical protein